MTRRDAAAVVLAWLAAGRRDVRAADLLRVDLGTATRIIVVSGTREVSVSVDDLLEALR